MALQVKINSVDKSNIVRWPTLVWTQTLTKEVDRLEFDVIIVSGAVPEVGDDVQFLENAVKLFGGILVEKNQKIEGGLLVGYELRCKDYSHVLDKKMVVRTYTGKMAKEIISDILTNFTDGSFTMNNVPATTPNVKSIKFNYESVTRALTQLAEQVSWDWYVDANKDIHFIDSAAVPAPFGLTDTNGKFIWGSLEYKKTILNLKNSIYVRGGERKMTLSEANARDKFLGNGTQTVFPMAYKYENLSVKVAGVSQTIGTDNVTDPVTVNCLYNFNEKFLRFPTAPASAASIVMYGDAYIPILVNALNEASVATYGEYQDVIVDKSITTVEEARMRAEAELAKYAENVNEITFKTREMGLLGGMTINVNSAIRGINKDFKIIKIIGKAIKYDLMEYDVSLLASGQITFTDIMVELLTKDKKNIVIATNEVLQKIKKATDSFSISDAAPTGSKTSQPYRWGPTTSLGPNSSASITDDAAVGVLTWSTPENAAASDNQYATASIPGAGNAITHYLKALNFGFAISADAVINGIQVEIERHTNFQTLGTKDNEVKIVKSGVVGATDKKKADVWPLSDEYAVYGGASDLWGETWTPADINSNNFGMVLSALLFSTGPPIAGFVDHIRITVYFTVNGSPMKWSKSLWG